MMDRVIASIAQAWRGRQTRAALLEDYRSLGLHKLFLADVARLGGVFTHAPRTAGDVFGDGINEGRRQMALEILRLCNANHVELLEILERVATTKGDRT